MKKKVPYVKIDDADWIVAAWIQTPEDTSLRCRVRQIDFQSRTVLLEQPDKQTQLATMDAVYAWEIFVDDEDESGLDDDCFCGKFTLAQCKWQCRANEANLPEFY
jgi:hypothetical protein